MTSATATPVSQRLTYNRLVSYLLTYLKGVLSGAGREQAALTADRLRRTNISFDEIIHSTLDRAVQTANIIHASLPTVTLRADEMLVEGGPVPPLPTITYWHLPSKVSSVKPHHITSMDFSDYLQRF